MRIVSLTKQPQTELLELLKGRNPASYTGQQAAVDAIISEVREKKDEAVLAYEKKFDHCELTKKTLRVTREEIEEAYRELDP